MKLERLIKCRVCSDEKLVHLCSFSSPAPFEKNLLLNPDNYYREVYHCVNCGHYLNHHNLGAELEIAYQKLYGKSSYGDLQDRLDSLLKLPKNKSTNSNRIENLINWLLVLKHKIPNKLLDIGTGSGVFAVSMMKKGWQVTGIDVDRTLTEHLERQSNINTLCTNYIDFQTDKRFSLVTFNKVLEHLPEVIAREYLIKSKGHLTSDGAIYLEVPSGTLAAEESLDRQEFFLEHYGAYSVKSLTTLVHQCGLKIVKLHELKEIGEKYTIRALLKS